MERSSSGYVRDCHPTATLLALLRAGEQSAAAAFERIARRLSAGERSLAAAQLAHLIDDERLHDEALAAQAAALPQVAVGDAATRRFFRRLESREPHIHLARVAALDGCVCQVLGRILRSSARQHLDAALGRVLAGIRLDEARHVRTARGLCVALDMDAAQLTRIGCEVRYDFAALLITRASCFQALGVDSVELIACIRRDR